MPTKNPEAYDNYLRALALLNRQGFGQLGLARQALERAIALDLNFAQAWARLALAESEIYFGGAAGEGEHTAAQIERARHAAETAMRLQPDLSDSHLGLGSFYYYCLKDFDRALAELNEAHKRAPNDAYVIFATGLVKRRMGKLDEALKLQHEAVVLDPRNADMWVNLGRSYSALREFRRPRKMYDRAIAIAPDEPDIVAEKANTFIIEGNLDEAEAVVARADNSVLGGAFGTRLTISIMRRQFDRAIELLARSLNAKETPPKTRAGDRVTLGALQLAANDPAGRATGRAGRTELMTIRDDGDTSPESAGALILANAWLGDRAAVDREGEALLREAARDRWDLPRAQVAVASAYAILHDPDRAVACSPPLLPLPATLLRRPPCYGSIQSGTTSATTRVSEALLRWQALTGFSPRERSPTTTVFTWPSPANAPGWTDY